MCGDRGPGARGWVAGVGPLLAAALGAVEHNVAFQGARVACVRERQLPAVLEHRPDAAIVVAGMNDTLRSDFDPVKLREDLRYVVVELQRRGLGWCSRATTTTGGCSGCPSPSSGRSRRGSTGSTR
ncbi:GDSL-type esterase/lipase family protein [Actinokineospora soli]|uniref:GDSL-type esterase/lipase family protein n=1 Tax=Actinokineospora soli TaxID=1048753 RepID=A0ABW2TMY7_9PSEU